MSSLTQRVFGKIMNRRPPIGEVAAVRARLAGDVFRTAAYSPDDLVSSKGFVIYDEMQHDSQVRSCLNTKKFAVLSKGWQILPASDRGEDVEIADFVQFCLDDMRGSVQDMIFNALDAIAKGFSVLEINYKIIRSGPHAGRIGLESVKSKDPAAFGFDMDEYLNIRGLTMQASGTRVALPLEKFIVYTYMPAYEMPHGQSDLRSAYKHWWCKEVISKFWNVHLEKYGMPTAKGSYRRGMPKDQQDELLRVLDRIQQETAIVVPEDVGIELLEAQRGGEAGYMQAIEFHNRQIAKAILGQTLTTDEGSRAGSFAMARVHQDVLGFYLQKLKRDMEETVMRDQLIRRLVDINFASGAYPKFDLGGVEERDLTMLGGLIEKLINGSVISPDEPWIREYLGLPAA
ncbi:MAG: phage portal protein family protein [Armatimonadota bacterium]